MKQNQYTLLLLDVDGTLVESKPDSLPSQRVVDAVQAVAERIDVAIITGRPYAHAKGVIAKLGLSGIGVFHGGAEIIDIVSGEQLRRQSMDVELAQRVAEVALPFGYKVFNSLGDDESEIKAAADITEPSDKLLIENVPTAESARIVTALEAIEGTITHPVTSWSDEDDVNITIAHEFASKHHGAEQIMELLGHDKSSTMAIGDGHNDIPLIKVAGLGVAMGDAPDEVKAIADYVTGSLAEDGVAQAIEKFILD